MFQFYDSPIKRTVRRRSIKEFIRFQFYDSPIKSMWNQGFGRPKSFGFNSMIVRLKDCIKTKRLI